MKSSYLDTDHPEVRHSHPDGPLVLAATLLGRLFDRVDAYDGHTIAGNSRLALRPETQLAYFKCLTTLAKDNRLVGSGNANSYRNYGWPI